MNPIGRRTQPHSRFGPVRLNPASPWAKDLTICLPFFDAAGGGHQFDVLTTATCTTWPIAQGANGRSYRAANEQRAWIYRLLRPIRIAGTLLVWMTPVVQDTDGAIRRVWAVTSVTAASVALEINGFTDKYSFGLRTPSFSFVQADIPFANVLVNQMSLLAFRYWHDGTDYYVQSYINGAYVAQGTRTEAAWSTATSMTAELDQNVAANAQDSVTDIHELRHYDRLLSVDEIRALVNPATRFSLYRSLPPVVGGEAAASKVPLMMRAYRTRWG